MKATETLEQESPTHPGNSVVQFPLGLLGFEQNKEYLLLSHPDEAPFLWLQMADKPNLSFLVVSPFEIKADYCPDLSEEDVSFLGLESPEDALTFNIVTLRSNGTATANLKGPILVNRHSLIAKQVIPLNAADFPIQFPIVMRP